MAQDRGLKSLRLSLNLALIFYKNNRLVFRKKLSFLKRTTRFELSKKKNERF